MERVLEPELMEDARQARAYARADFADVNQGFVDRFLEGSPDLVAGRVLDCGCGPADIPIRMARARPGITVAAVDGSAAMLREAQQAIAAAGTMGRVRLLRARIQDLPFRAQSFDAVISNSLLHHLRHPGVFWREVLRMGQPRAAVMVMDLVRPESPILARDIVDAAAGDEDPLLKEDFYRSLLASFTVAEVRAQLGVDLTFLDCRMVSERHWLASGRLP